MQLVNRRRHRHADIHHRTERRDQNAREQQLSNANIRHLFNIDQVLNVADIVAGNLRHPTKDPRKGTRNADAQHGSHGRSERLARHAIHQKHGNRRRENNHQNRRRNRRKTAVNQRQKQKQHADKREQQTQNRCQSLFSANQDNAQQEDSNHHIYRHAAIHAVHRRHQLALRLTNQRDDMHPLTAVCAEQIA